VKSFSILLSILLSIPVVGVGVVTFDSKQRKCEKIIQEAVDAIKSDQYLAAEDLILKAIETDSTNIRAYLILSDVSDELKNSQQKQKALEKIVSLDSVNYPLAYKLLATNSLEKGNYSDALHYLTHYRQFHVSKDSLWIEAKIKSCFFSINSILESQKVPITHLDSTINTPNQEYWPFVLANDSFLYFTRLIENERKMPLERIFVSEKEDSCWAESTPVNFSNDDEENIGTICFSADGNLLFFTSCGRYDSRGSCDIYYSRKIDGLWTRPVNAGDVNSGNWDAQPSVSSDNRYLYFASNRPGGKGGMDIWRSEMSEGRLGVLTFKTPVNLGLAINSPEDDFSPFIHADGTTLYFSSKGRIGMGGSDIFLSRLKDSVWSEAINPGAPINTCFNEDGLTISPTSAVAVFSSNRDGSVCGSKDLYQINLPERYRPEKVGYLCGSVYDSETRLKIDATIKLTQLETNNSQSIHSGTDGYMVTMKAESMYAFEVESKGYLFYSRNFDLGRNKSFNQAERLDIFLDPIKPGKTIVLSNVFFDFDSDSLTKESFPELNHLSGFLMKNPKLVVEISGHTDNVGSAVYNQKLSEDRARAIADFLKRTIRPDRLVYRGYGSTKPVATNETEEGRALNRRSEITVLSN